MITLYRSRKKVESNIDEILDKIRYNYDTGLVPLNNSLVAYNNERVSGLNSYENLRDSLQCINNIQAKCTKLINLLKVINSGNSLENLTSFKDIYPCRAHIVDEIIHYHNKYHNKKTNVLESNTRNSDYSCFSDDSNSLSSSSSSYYT